MMDTNKRKVNLYMICTIIPIVIAIFHLLFAIIFQSTCKVDTESKLVTGACFGGMFSFASFLTLLVSPSEAITQIKSVEGVVNLVIALPMIFFATTANKKKGHFIFFSALVYEIDAIFMIPLLIMNAINTYPYTLTSVDITLTILFHVVFLIVLAFCSIIEYKEYKKMKNNHEVDKDDVLYMGK